MTDAERLKLAGQSASLFSLSESTWGTFKAILETIPAGHQVHVNGMRHLLDAAEIAPSMRGGMFALAVRRGLISPLLTTDGNEIRTKSTGKSAHQASVRLYIRTAA